MMTRLSARFVTLLSALLLLGLVAPTASAGDDKSGKITVWTVTDGDKTIGTESLRVVKKGGAVYASGERKIKKGKGKGHWKTHVQRSADGETVKYRRIKAGRKGPGVFGFKKGGNLRVVGVNQKMKPSEHGVLDRMVWENKTWHQLKVWIDHTAGDAATIKWFEVGSKEMGEATFKKGDRAEVANKDGAAVSVTVWSLSGVPGDPLQVYVDDKKRLVGVKQGQRQMLKKGWAWEASAAPAADDDDDEGGKATKKAGADDAADGEGTVDTDPAP